MKIPENYRKVAHRYDQYKQTEITIYHGADDQGRGTFFIEVNEKLLGPLTKIEIECLMDSLRNDLDFKNPAVFA